MTALSPAIPVPFTTRSPASDVAVNLDDSVIALLYPRLLEIGPEIASLCTKRLTDRVTAAAALNFALQLPRWLPSPEISADPDGEISFDWFGSSGKMYSVSIDQSGRLSYAGWFREDSRTHGTEKLSEIPPEEILRGIARATS